MDLLFITGSKTGWGEYEELKYSLRSYEENYKDLGKVYIVGVKPKWIKGVNHIPMDDIYDSHVPGNIISKIIRGCLSDISEDFVFSADDYFILKPIDDTFLSTPPTWGDYKTFKGYNSGYYAQVLKNTIDYLKSKNLPCWNYEAHTPYKINKNKYSQIMVSSPYVKGLGFTSTTVYFNSIKQDVNINTTEVAGYINSRMSYKKVESKCEGKVYCNINGGRVSQEIKKFLKNKFPNKSKWEK